MKPLKKTIASQSAFFNPRMVLGLFFAHSPSSWGCLGLLLTQLRPPWPRCQIKETTSPSSVPHIRTTSPRRSAMWRRDGPSNSSNNMRPLRTRRFPITTRIALTRWSKINSSPRKPSWHHLYLAPFLTLTAFAFPALDVIAPRPIPMGRWEQRSSFRW
jgi:hypothetical protein